MAPCPVKKYAITGSKWHSQHLEIQQSGIPFLYVNANNKYGPWKDPYVTIHQDAKNGEIVAAAKLGAPGWARDFKIFLGNPDCTDLNTWPLVSCKGKSAYEYRFCVQGQEFAWRRTRDRQLGAKRKGHRDFKLVAFGARPASTTVPLDLPRDKCLLDIDIEEQCSPTLTPTSTIGDEEERIVAIYFMDTSFGSSAREAKINFFEHLAPDTELWCLAAILGVQEKISKNQDVFLLSSLGYGGGLWALGNYI